MKLLRVLTVVVGIVGAVLSMLLVDLTVEALGAGSGEIARFLAGAVLGAATASAYVSLDDIGPRKP